MEDDLSKLIIRAQRKDKDAFGQIYSLFFQRIYRFIYYSVHNQQLAEDITQDTFLRAWRALASFSTSRGSFQAFLFAIARNLVIDWYRKKKEISLEAVADPSYLEHVDEKITQDEEKQQLNRVLDKLKFDQRQIITLRYFEELSFFEIGKVVHLSEGAVRVRLHRILKQLKSYLKEKDYET